MSRFSRPRRARGRSRSCSCKCTCGLKDYAGGNELEEGDQRPIVINVSPPIVNVPAPIVHVAPAEVKVAAPVVNVTPPKVEVTVAPDLSPSKRKVEIQRDANGFITGAKEI